MAADYASFFAGNGGLDLAVRIAFPAARCVSYVEINREAAETLAARIGEGSLDPAPIWSDARTFPCEIYRGRLAGLIAGFPCPDYSLAGKRAGIVGKHGQLWDDLAATIRDLGPDWVLLENVSGILLPHGSDDGAVLPAGLWFVLGDLAGLGLDAEWMCLRASDIGASHGRNRWFCLAYRKGGRLGELRQSPGRDGLTDRRHGQLGNPRGREAWWQRNGTHRQGLTARGSGVLLGDASDDNGRWGIGGTQTGAGADRIGRRRPSGSGLELADAECQPTGAQQFSDPRERPDRSAAHGSVPRVSESELLFAPGPGERDRWEELLVRYPWLRPAISQAEAESHLRGVADGLADMVAIERTDALRGVGNGVVPLQAAYAAVTLARRTGLII